MSNDYYCVLYHMAWMVGWWPVIIASMMCSPRVRLRAKHVTDLHPFNSYSDPFSSDFYPHLIDKESEVRR